MSGTPWILLLFTLPTGRSSVRVGVWRKLRRVGALAFKTSAYLLPNRPDLLERFQWIAQQVIDAGGEATLLFVSELDGVTHQEIVRQFIEARAEDYRDLSEALNELIGRHRKKPGESLAPELEKLRRQFAEIRRLDFFDSAKGHDVGMLIERAAALPEKGASRTAAKVLKTAGFVGKTWLTRPQPAIDRVGSAWLIRKFIDPRASFVFASDFATHPDAIPYDMMGAEFTHHGEDCTFETLLKRFELSDPVLRRMGEMVHDADLEDGKFQTTEATGLDRVFKGWAALGLPDQEIFERGFPCFDALHAILKPRR
jgi:hypothetical protein